jgi:hypothetical protein
MLALALVAATTDPARYLLERVAETHARLGRYGVVASKTTVGPVATTIDRYHIFVGSGQTDVAWQGPGVSARWSVSEGTVRHVDLQSGRFTEEPRGGRTVREAIVAEAVGLDPFVLALIDPPALSRLIQRWDVAGFSVESSGKETRLARRSGLSQDLLAWDRETRLVTTRSHKTERFGVEWRLSFMPGESSPPRLPPGARRVDRLSPVFAPPVYESRSAQRLAESVFARYDRPGRLGYRVQGEGEPTRVKIEGRVVWQRDAAAEWRYDGVRLILHSLKGGWAYDGPAKVSDVIDAVARAGSRVDPLLRGLMTGKNPLRVWLGQGARVAVVGSIRHRGERGHVLQAKSGAGQATVIVRASDSTVLSASFAGPDGLAGPAKVYEPDPGPPPDFQVPPQVRRTTLAEALGRD